MSLSCSGISDRDKYKSDHPDFAKKDFPIVFFSTGNNAYRFGYSAIAQSIAAQGYVVISMDHPYDAAVLEYPDGHLVFLSPDADGQPSSEIPKMIDTRVKDFQFVLDQLAKKSVVKSLAPGVWKGDAPPNLGHVPIYGHSEGGGAALTAMQRDERFIGGLNYDGDLDSVPYDKNKGLKQPYIYFSSQASGKNEPDLIKLFPSFKWALNLFLKKSQHGTFTDLPLIAHVLGLEPLTGQVAQVFGKVPGDRGMEIMTAYTTAFLKFCLNGAKKVPTLLDAQMNNPNVAGLPFPEVLYLRENP